MKKRIYREILKGRALIAAHHPEQDIDHALEWGQYNRIVGGCIGNSQDINSGLLTYQQFCWIWKRLKKQMKKEYTMYEQYIVLQPGTLNVLGWYVE